MVPATARFIAQMRGMRRHIVENNVTEFAVFQNWCDENNERGAGSSSWRDWKEFLEKGKITREERWFHERGDEQDGKKKNDCLH